MMPTVSCLGLKRVKGPGSPNRRVNDGIGPHSELVVYREDSSRKQVGVAQLTYCCHPGSADQVQ